MYGTEPRYNEILVITNTIQKPKRKIYLDITKNEAATALRYIILSFDKTGSKEKELLRSLSSMADTFLRKTIKKTEAIPSKIIIFFSMKSRDKKIYYNSAVLKVTTFILRTF